MLRKILKRISGGGAGPVKTGIRSSFPNGHFYSPVTDPVELIDRQGEIWPTSPRPCLDIDFNDDSHRRILTEWFPRNFPDYDYPEHESASGQFYTQNSQFSWLDSRSLFVLLKELKPRRVIEIGSGFSTLLTADVNHRFLGSQIDFSCIEPYPTEFLKGKIPGMNKLLVRKVESLELGFFESLEPGDILFIDSSHVSKTGSDVNHIIFEILPRLTSGVLIHFHDIFLPFEYPKDWAVTENRSWNEQYLLRALLMNSDAYKVLFGCNYAHYKFKELLVKGLNLPGGRTFGGGSFWLEKS